MEKFLSLPEIYLTIISTLFTWGVTALGALTVIFFKKINQKFLDTMLGFAAGVMIAASFWSLLEPAIELSKNNPLPVWFPPAAGFLLGAITLRIIDSILPHLHLETPIEEKEGIKTRLSKSILLILAITIHNIPEGLAIGVAFGAVSHGIEGASTFGALALAIGIGLQNFPEGMAIAFPIRRDGNSRLKSFFYGQLSGIVEPIAAIIGYYSVAYSRFILPYALSFAAGAMIYVVVEEVIPEAERNKNTDIATIGAILGFTIMMILDVGLK
ncbi:MAG: ZIP family metal transporter [Brevinematia bacterium]